MTAQDAIAAIIAHAWLAASLEAHQRIAGGSQHRIVARDVDDQGRGWCGVCYRGIYETADFRGRRWRHDPTEGDE